MNRVKELRKERKITQAKLAQELGISRSAVAMYETDKCDLSNEMLVALSNFFDVSTDYLLCQSDIMETLSPEDRRRVLEFGRGLAATSHKPKQQK